jgi:hypothetical protein
MRCGRIAVTQLIESIDHLLTTTVRKRLDLTPGSRGRARCLRLASRPHRRQPQGWRWLVVDDEQARHRGAVVSAPTRISTATAAVDAPTRARSSQYLTDHLHSAVRDPCIGALAGITVERRGGRLLRFDPPGRVELNSRAEPRLVRVRHCTCLNAGGRDPRHS